MASMKFRNESEINEMLSLIESLTNIEDPQRLNKFSYDQTFQHFSDFASVLRWVLKKISAHEDKNQIIKEMSNLEKYPDEMESDEYEKHLELLNNTFFKGSKNENWDSDGYIYDAFLWIKGEESTKNILSEDYLNLDELKKKISGEVPMTIEKKEVYGIPINNLSDQEKDKIFDIIDKMKIIQENIYEIKGILAVKVDYLQLIKARYTTKISLEIDAKGKRIYPNKDAVDAEVTQKLKIDEDYQTKFAEYRELHKQLSSLKIEYNNLSDKKGILLGFVFANEKYYI